VAGYLEAILQRIGLRARGFMVIMEIQMTRPGYFLFTINPNSKLDKIRNNMRYSIISKAYVYLEVVLI
jgi:hypothetical protein